MQPTFLYLLGWALLGALVPFAVRETWKLWQRKRRLPCGHTPEEHAEMGEMVRMQSVEERDRWARGDRDAHAAVILGALIAAPLFDDEKRHERDPRLLVKHAFAIANEFATVAKEDIPIVGLTEAAARAAQATDAIARELRPLAATRSEIEALLSMNAGERSAKIAALKAAVLDIAAKEQADYRAAREAEDAAREKIHAEDRAKHEIFDGYRAAGFVPAPDDAQPIHVIWQKPIEEFRGALAAYIETRKKEAA